MPSHARPPQPLARALERPRCSCNIKTRSSPKQHDPQSQTLSALGLVTKVLAEAPPYHRFSGRDEVHIPTLSFLICDMGMRRALTSWVRGGLNDLIPKALGEVFIIG